MTRADVLNWYAGLSSRDQRVLRLGAVVVALIVCVWIFLPLQRNLSAAKAQFATRQGDLEWMRSVAPTLAAAGPGAAAVATPESLVVLIDRSAREAGLGQALTGSQPGANGAMRVQLEKADFNLLIAWLSRLSAQHGVRVETASVTGASDVGRVNVSVQLRAR
jgi:general secretion pathway protein M